MEKPGYKTTEAWGSFLTTILLLLVSYGIFTQEQADSLLALILPAIPLILSIVPMTIYTVQRTGLKKEEAKTQQVQAQAQIMMAAAQMPPAQAAPFMAAAVMKKD